MARVNLMNWKTIDNQMAQWETHLTEELRLSREHARKLATIISSEVRFLKIEDKQKIIDASPIPLADRLSELEAFQGWMDQASQIQGNPYVTRAQVLSQNYICFVYLPESCFRVLSKVAPAGSATKRCSQFLSNNPIRAFRNAIAHANWTYNADFSGLVYWARKGQDQDEPLNRFEVTANVLSFWQALSRCAAYAAFSNI